MKNSNESEFKLTVKYKESVVQVIVVERKIHLERMMHTWMEYLEEPNWDRTNQGRKDNKSILSVE